MGFFGALIGIALAVGVTMLVMITLVKHSNDWGDSDSGRMSMSSFNVVEDQNGVPSNYSVDL